MRREISGSPPNDVCHVTARGLFPSAPRRGRNPPGARLERPAPATPAAKRALPCKDPQMHQKKTLLFPSGCLPLLFLPSRITLRRGGAWSRSCLSRTRKFKSSMKGLKSRNGPWFEEDDLTFTIFPEKKKEKKKSTDKHDRFYRAPGAADMAAMPGLGAPALLGADPLAGAVPAPGAGRRLCQPLSCPCPAGCGKGRAVTSQDGHIFDLYFSGFFPEGEAQGSV